MAEPNAACLTCGGSGKRTWGFDGTLYGCGTCDGRGRVRLDAIESTGGLRASEYARLISDRAVLLAGAATGDLHHLADPIAWLAQRSVVVYRITGPFDPRARAVSAQPAAEDRGAWLRYRDAVCSVWRAWLGDRGWEPADADNDGAYRSPSGACYRLASGRSTPALDVALARDRRDVTDVLAEANAIARRVHARLKVPRG